MLEHEGEQKLGQWRKGKFKLSPAPFSSLPRSCCTADVPVGFTTSSHVVPGGCYSQVLDEALNHVRFIIFFRKSLTFP